MGNLADANRGADGVGGLEGCAGMNDLAILELLKHEAVIERGLKTFVDVGNALSTIRDDKLYRQSHNTFEEYCQERWGMTRQYASYQIQAADVVSNLSTIVDKVPATESQARPLTGLAPEVQREVWEEVIETAPDSKVTAVHVERIVKAHVSQATGENEWYTPPEYTDAARRVMGGIDLDPASSAIANESVKATAYFTKDDDGLAWDWEGRIWLNPPYAQPLISHFCEKLGWDLDNGFITEAITLTNNATETKWYQGMASRCSAKCEPAGRIRFIDKDGNPGGAPLQGQVILYFGPSTKVNKFADEFKKFGLVFYAR